MLEGASRCLTLQGPGDKACSPNTEMDAFLSHFMSASAWVVAFPSQTDSLCSPLGRRVPVLEGASARLGVFGEACFWVGRRSRARPRGSCPGAETRSAPCRRGRRGRLYLLRAEGMRPVVQNELNLGVCLAFRHQGRAPSLLVLHQSHFGVREHERA